MNDQQYRLMSLLGQAPARLTAEEVATVLKCQAHDVPVLVAAKLLKPLGNPAQNSVKFFATRSVLELAKDEKWLHRVTLTINQHWHKRNARSRDERQSADDIYAEASGGSRSV